MNLHSVRLCSWLLSLVTSDIMFSNSSVFHDIIISIFSCACDLIINNLQLKTSDVMFSSSSVFHCMITTDQYNIRLSYTCDLVVS